jgi:hypothetical protein
MTAAARSVDSPDAYVEVISEANIKSAVDRSLSELGVTFQELAEQARRGRFRSERARLVWMAIADLGPQG